MEEKITLYILNGIFGIAFLYFIVGLLCFLDPRPYFLVTVINTFITIPVIALAVLYLVVEHYKQKMKEGIGPSQKINDDNRTLRTVLYILGGLIIAGLFIIASFYL